MRQWLVRLKGEEFDLKELPKLFDSAEAMVIIEDGDYYLKSTRFADLSAAEEVLRVAIEMVDMINDVAFLHFDNIKSADVDAVAEVHEDGSRCHHVFLRGSATARSRVGVARLTVTDSSGNAVESYQPSAAIVIMGAARRHTAVADALHFHRKSDWGSLYKVFELIRDDVGGERRLIQRGCVSKRVLSRFRRTAQSRDAIGDEARHASKRYTAPRHPMTLSEARGVIKGILEHWLQTK